MCSSLKALWPFELFWKLDVSSPEIFFAADWVYSLRWGLLLFEEHSVPYTQDEAHLKESQRSRESKGSLKALQAIVGNRDLVVSSTLGANDRQNYNLSLDLLSCSVFTQSVT
jgi:hypothetical protein